MKRYRNSFKTPLQISKQNRKQAIESWERVYKFFLEDPKNRITNLLAAMDLLNSKDDDYFREKYYEVFYEIQKPTKGFRK